MSGASVAARDARRQLALLRECPLDRLLGPRVTAQVDSLTRHQSPNGDRTGQRSHSGMLDGIVPEVDFLEMG
eukprot:2151852-Prymnesium_polylepis.1